MRWLRAFKPKPCQVIEAVFVFGPQRCGTLTRRRVRVDGEVWFNCGSHEGEYSDD